MSSSDQAPRLTSTQWLICIIASIGFAFDIYELLMMPLIAQSSLGALLKVDPSTQAGFDEITAWTGRIMWGSAICGGVFGLLGGYLTDLFGCRRVLVWSILLYAGSAAAAGFSTSPEMLLVLRCTTFIGVCVEFVAAVAWLSELFPNPKQREAVLGYTQAFSSIGGLMVTFAYKFCVANAETLPAIVGDHSAWRYTLISGLIPALPLIVIRPFLPESDAWRVKRTSGNLKRPSIGMLFSVPFRRTTIVTAVLFACGYGAAFGAIQFTPQIVPGLIPEGKQIGPIRKELGALAKEGKQDTSEYKDKKASFGKLVKVQQDTVANVQLFQEVGGLVGRFALAWLAVRVVSRRKLLRFFQWPGLLIVPLVFALPAANNLGEQSLDVLKVGMFLAGFFTVAQFSFWGNYLPRVYPTHLRGTGEGFAANVGGRMFGTAANFLTATLSITVMSEIKSRPTALAYSAAAVALLVYGVGSVVSCWLPEPTSEELPE